MPMTVERLTGESMTCTIEHLDSMAERQRVTDQLNEAICCSPTWKVGLKDIVQSCSPPLPSTHSTLGPDWHYMKD